MKLGPFTFTRDSAWWGVSAVLSFAAVLATLTDPSGPMSLAYYGIPASWLPYIRLLALVNTWLSGKMANSPAPDSGEVARGIRDNGRPIALLLAVALSMASIACAKQAPDVAPTAQRIAAITVVSAHAVLSTIQDTERALVCGYATAPPAPACVPVDQHRAISGQLARAFDIEIKLAKIVKAVPLSADVGALLGEITDIVDAVLELIPASAQRQALVAQLGGA